MRSAAPGAAVLVVAVALIGSVVTALGLYDIGADAPHLGVTRAFIGYVRDRSIAVRARAIAVPNLSNPERIADGASDYDAMCTQCHLAPGLADNEMRLGLYPKPPLLATHQARAPAEQFWIIKHGIKMSAMPAWGTTHSDNEIWNMVAFLQELPALTPVQYRATVESAVGHHDHDESMHMDMPH
jgi:mono/diheme cytochrome c family protein